VIRCCQALQNIDVVATLSAGSQQRVGAVVDTAGALAPVGYYLPSVHLDLSHLSWLNLLRKKSVDDRLFKENVNFSNVC
jgi:hypothetical protein